jgi:hypothetical protein
MTEALFIAITIIDLLAAGIIFGGALSDLTLRRKTWFKTALVIGAIGLTVQGVRNLQFLITGVSPLDSDVPLWMLKDLGLALIAFSYFYLIASSYFKKRKPQEEVKAVEVEKPKRRYYRKVKGN